MKLNRRKFLRAAGVSLALACDRRRVGGPQAARFLADLAAAVEEPAGWT